MKTVSHLYARSARKQKTIIIHLMKFIGLWWIVQVIKLLLENYYWTLSGSTQTALLRITDTAKDIGQQIQ
jgi:hypothetical protein